MPTATQPESMTIPQPGGPELEVKAENVEMFQALQTLTAEEGAPAHFVAAVFRNHYDRPLKKDEAVREIIGMTEIDKALREGAGIPVLAEVNWSLKVGVTGARSRLAVREATRDNNHTKLAVACQSVDALDAPYGGVEEIHEEAKGRKKPLVEGNIPGVAITERDHRTPNEVISEALRCANTVWVAGHQAVEAYLEARTEYELTDDSETGLVMHYHIPWRDDSGDRTDQFASNSSLWAVAALKDRGVDLSVRYVDGVREIGTDALARIVAGGFGVKSDASDPRTMSELIKRLPAVEFYSKHVDAVTNKALAIVQEEAAYDALSGVAAEHGSDTKTMVAAASANTMRHLVGIES